MLVAEWNFGLEQNGITIIGNRDVWGGSQPFGILHRDRRQHLYTLGKSGTGKTTLLRNIILQDILNGYGVGVIDPHGDLATELLDYIPPHRIDDVVYFNPVDIEYPISFNLFGSVHPDHRHLVASGVVSIFKGIWADFFGPRMEYIFYAAVAALLDCENVSLLGVPRMLTDARYRTWVVKQVKDPIVKSFWVNEFDNYGDKFLQEAIAPIQNKVGQMLMSPHLRNILGQVKSKMDARFIMDNRRIFIADLSKGKLGEDKSNLIGALLVAQFQLAAMSRADMPEEKRKDFFLHVDEFQSFASNSFISILSEARKYRLCLTLSHQYVEQLKPEIRNAVFGNVGSIIAFRVGKCDAEMLEQEFGGGYTANRFTDLSNYEVCAKMLVNGQNQEPFSGKTIVSGARRYGRSENIIKQSREKYSVQRSIVERKIKLWLENT